MILALQTSTCWQTPLILPARHEELLRTAQARNSRGYTALYIRVGCKHNLYIERKQSVLSTTVEVVCRRIGARALLPLSIL